MNMSKSIHFFSNKETLKSNIDKTLLGIRGRQLNEFSELGLPIVPGLVMDATITQTLQQANVLSPLRPFLKKMGEAVKKEFGDPENPLLLKLVISPNLVIANYPTLHNFGLAKTTIGGFEKKVGTDFASHEVLFLLRGIFSILFKIAELQEDNAKQHLYKEQLEKIESELKKEKRNESGTTVMDKYQPYLPQEFFSTAEVQLNQTIQLISTLLSLEPDNENDVALLIQPLVYGNYDKESFSGRFFSRNIVTGEKKLQGMFFQEKFDEVDALGKDINDIKPVYLEQLEAIAWRLEDHSKDVREIRFTIEAGKLWLIEQKSVEAKSTIALVHFLLDLYNRKIVDAEYVVKNVKPGQLNEILHPVINMTSVKNLQHSKGGIAGAPGAAVGRVYFSADALIEAQHIARLQSADTRCILCVPASYAGDVKAIEVSTGVLSNEGGYSAHASVVSRQYGKISLVRPDMKIMANKAIINGITIKEGDYITLQVPYYGESTVYFGAAELIEPDPKTSGLLDFIDLTRSFIQDFHVRANADSPRDAALAVSFGAEGIGLCRTEHMFFETKRINPFREMILSETTEERIKVLNKLQKVQMEDFYGIFKTMAGREVTIRLLDAPLHEFLPHNDTELNEFIEHLKKETKKTVTKKALLEKIELCAEVNPMLGHRGCRIAISYPEIYAMQIRAIFEAAYKLQKEGVETHVEIMVPIVMNFRELKQIAYGKKIEGHAYLGIRTIEQEMRAQFKAKPIDFKIGTMIELPVAALSAGEIARYAEFFSFGTNDLTQTTLGLSRDDFNSFMPDYTLYDLIDGNPFAILDPGVRELISIAIERGKLTRPDIKLGLCGEQGARPENIPFCMKAGLNYVSCSSYSVPIALLSIAQAELEKAENEGRKLTRKAVSR
ncbi:pyruvate, phosphate dikinase [Treponema vincentii]|uniref:Pyruvate, phosphate dikinase n=1 Tax=Treponema vincentii TaxID=69710 RepID=A0A6P1Y024_9SPIR|nr:putative PEP-binding protein [Treponema vincentii]QHX42965.1 pyruvate, phosphate dikinase [Treponema vincentii]